LLAATAPLHAVIVAGGDGTQNLSAPADDFGWASVGIVTSTNGGIAVAGEYLGDGWVLSAYHGVSDATQTGFAFSSVYFGGLPYTVDPASAVRLHHPGGGLADLAVFHLTLDPPVPALAIASAAPTDNLSVVMMGFGPSRDPNETHWNVNTTTNPFTWTETPGPGNAQGYKWANPQALRWGTNNVTAFAGGSTTGDFDDGFGTVTAFRTNFTNTPGEAQAGAGDSGGGVFWKVGGQWQLGGIMLFTAGFNGQPFGTAVYGNETYAANLATYRPEITSIIPEPSTAALALVGAGFALRRRQASLDCRGKRSATPLSS
jgi:hypothetical protein